MKTLPEYLAAGVLATTLGAAVWAHAANGVEEPGAADDAGSGQAFAIRGAQVFDGEKMIERANVVVRDGKIAAVGADVAIPDGIETVDAAGKTLLPGLFDAHVHAWGNAQQDMARFGVTTALDMHGSNDRLPALRRQRESLQATGQADLWAAGYAVTAPGGHGTQYGFPVPTIEAGTDIDAFVGKQVEGGADYIKLIIEDLSAYGMQKNLPTLSAQQVTDVIAAAHKHKRMAVTHVAKLEDARHAIDSGSDGLVHVFTDAVADDAFVASMREHKAFVIPTLTVVASMGGEGAGKALAGDTRVKPFLTAEQTGTLASDFGAKNPGRLQRATESVRKLHAAGVDILAGSDAPNPGTAHGASLHHELALLVDAGLSPVQALAAATSVPARRFGIEDRGRIANGLRADLVLVEGDPSVDIAATRDIAVVWKNGHRVERNPAAATSNAMAVPDGSLVSDFEGGGIEAAFGSWQPTTDRIAGGASVVTHALVEGGASGSKGALQVSGEVKAGFGYPWSGVIFVATPDMSRTMDLSARKELVFQVRGDGPSYNAMLFSGPSMQAMPSIQTFVAGKEWDEVRLPLDRFQGGDLGQVRGIALTAGQPLGAFEFRIDDVELR